jgi:hypothetical protein
LEASDFTQHIASLDCSFVSQEFSLSVIDSSLLIFCLIFICIYAFEYCYLLNQSTSCVMMDLLTWLQTSRVPAFSTFILEVGEFILIILKYFIFIFFQNLFSENQISAFGAKELALALPLTSLTVLDIGSSSEPH